MAGATNSTLNLTTVSLAQAGEYSVGVWNFAGAVTSQWARLTIVTNALTTFNLNFEKATNLPPSPGLSSVLATDAIPGWRAYFGNTERALVSYDAITLGSANIALISAASGFAPLEGTYSVALQGGIVDPMRMEVGPVSIATTRAVPMFANKLQFLASGDSLSVYVNGTPLPTSNVVGGVQVDISTWKGQVVEFRFATASAATMTRLDQVSFLP
jgi:hypothetical protein